MPATGTGTNTGAAAPRRRKGPATGTCGAAARGEAGTGRGRGAGRDAALRQPEAAALGGLLRGLRAGDLETVLLTVQMAADENRLPSADPDETARILAFLARLAEHDATLPLPPDGSRSGTERPSVDAAGAEDGAPDSG